MISNELKLLLNILLETAKLLPEASKIHEPDKCSKTLKSNKQADDLIHSNANDLIAYTATIDHRHIDYHYLYSLAKRHRLIQQVYPYLKQPHSEQSNNEQIDEIAYADFKASFYHERLSIMALTAETIRISDEFRSNNIAHAFIKGIVLNYLIYEDKSNRICSDLDIWVDYSYYTKAIDILSSLGYVKYWPSYELVGYKKYYYFSHKHDMAFYNSERNVLVELHFRLDYFTSDYFNFAQVKLKDISLANNHVYTLEDDYHLLYLMLHAAMHSYSRLRWLYDIMLYIKSSKSDLYEVLNLANRLKAANIVRFSLILVRDFFSFTNPIIENILADAARMDYYLAALSRQLIILDYEPENKAASSMISFVKYRWYLFMLARRGNKMRALLGDLVRIDRVFPYITMPKGFSFVYYLYYPLWVVKYMLSSCYQLILKLMKNKHNNMHNMQDKHNMHSKSNKQDQHNMQSMHHKQDDQHHAK